MRLKQNRFLLSNCAFLLQHRKASRLDGQLAFFRTKKQALRMQCLSLYVDN